VQQHIVLTAAEDPMVFTPSEEGQYFNSNTSQDVMSADITMNDERILYYDWLADSATISHICNTRNVFIMYQQTDRTPIMGVGSLTTHAEGRGTVLLQSRCEGRTYTLQLEDVLHVPGNKNNLILLADGTPMGADMLDTITQLPFSTGKETQSRVVQKLQTTSIKCALHITQRMNYRTILSA
jgi:Pol polyprotein